MNSAEEAKTEISKSEVKGNFQNYFDEIVPF